MRFFSKLLISVSCLLSFHAEGRADVTADLLDPQLEEQYDWAMFMDVHDLPKYMKYPDSRLNPVTNLRIIYRPLAKGLRAENYVKARVYEEFWYHDQMPIGLKRNQRLQIDSGKFGIIFIHPRDGERDHLDATANALTRIMVDLWLHDIIVGYVVVPFNQFDQMVSELGRYGFASRMAITDGAQLSIHLRSNPPGRDQVFYYQKGRR